MYASIDLQQPFGGLSHSFHRADGQCRTFGTVRLEDGNAAAKIYFNTPADIDAVIAELTALRAEMTAEPETAEPEPECGFQWKSADGLMHACALNPHGELFGHVTWTADGTALRPETAASVTA